MTQMGASLTNCSNTLSSNIGHSLHTKHLYQCTEGYRIWTGVYLGRAGVAVLTGEEVRGQHLLRVEDHERLAGQGRGTLVARLFQAVLRGGECIAVQDLDHIAREQSRQTTTQSANDVAKPRRGITDQFGGDDRLNALEFVVKGSDGNGEPIQVVLEDGMRAPVNAAGDQGHGVHHGGEEQVARVLRLRGALEEVVDGVGMEDVFQSALHHDAQRRVLDKAAEHLVEWHLDLLAT